MTTSTLATPILASSGAEQRQMGTPESRINRYTPVEIVLPPTATIEQMMNLGRLPNDPHNGITWPNGRTTRDILAQHAGLRSDEPLPNYSTLRFYQPSGN